MASKITPELTNDFLAGARVFAKAVREVFEAAVLKEVAGGKVTFPQLKMLYLVAQTGTVTVGDAAAFLGVTSAAASKAVEKLVRRRYLRRNDIQGDRRTSQLSITDASRRLLDAYEAARNQKAAEIFAQYSPEQLRYTAELLDHLAAGISEQTTSPDQVCVQCEVYFREECRFGRFGRRNCFYLNHRLAESKEVPA